MNTLESEPDSDIEFIVRAKDNSYIGLLAVDESVDQLKKGYDITSKNVADELKGYDVAAKGTPYPQFHRNAKSQFSWKPGSSNPHAAVYVSLDLERIQYFHLVIIIFRNLELIF